MGIKIQNLIDSGVGTDKCPATIDQLLEAIAAENPGKTVELIDIETPGGNMERINHDIDKTKVRGNLPEEIDNLLSPPAPPPEKDSKETTSLYRDLNKNAGRRVIKELYMLDLGKEIVYICLASDKTMWCHGNNEWKLMKPVPPTKPIPQGGL